ncbi:MAG: hypothetical protein LBO63_06440 [Oscillospiraceae bacterium]|nr:hypothetical protein [Oscillospiraceae bacterium]
MKKYVLMLFATLACAITLTGCNIQPVGSAGPPVSTMQSTPTIVVPETSAPSTSPAELSPNPIPEGTPAYTSITRAEIKELMERRATFDELSVKFNLQADIDFEPSLYATSVDFPNFEFYFTTDAASDGIYTFSGISAPVAILFPEYVGAMIYEISIVDDVSTVYGTQTIYMTDSLGMYSVTLTVPGILSGDDIVVVWPQ